MIYLQRHKPRFGSLYSKIVIAICSILVIVFVLFEWLSPHTLPNLANSIARPFWQAEFSIMSGSLKSYNQLLRENEELKRNLDEDVIRLSTITAIEKENIELKALMGQSTTTKLILAPVLVRPPVIDYDDMIIDGGTTLGFSAGDKVYAPGKVLIGRIVDVARQTSKVRLLSSPGEKYEVLIGPDNISATAIGRGGGQYRADLPRDVKVQEGDFVIAPSVDDKPFGSIVSVASDPTEPFETILFAPTVNIYQLRWVLIDTSNKN